MWVFGLKSAKEGFETLLRGGTPTEGEPSRSTPGEARKVLVLPRHVERAIEGLEKASEGAGGAQRRNGARVLVRRYGQRVLREVAEVGSKGGELGAELTDEEARALAIEVRRDGSPPKDMARSFTHSSRVTEFYTGKTRLELGDLKVFKSDDFITVDHLVPVSRMVRMRGYRLLTRAERVEIANMDGNLVQVSQELNSSRNNRPFSEWQGEKGGYLQQYVGPRLQELARLESAMETRMQARILETLRRTGRIR